LNTKKIYQFSENTLSLFSIKGIELALTIWLIPYLIFKVGIDNYGIYVFAMALILFFKNVLNYGFNLATVREIARNKHDKIIIDKIFSEVVSVRIFLLVLIYLILIGFIFLIPTYNTNKSLYFFASVILLGELFSLRWFFLGMEQMKFKAIINFLSTLLYIVLVLVLVQNDTDYIWIPFAEGIALLIVSFISFIWVLKKYKIHLKLITLPKIISYLIENFKVFINLLLPSTFSVIAVFLVGVFGLPSQVSMTQIGVKLSNAFTSINAILTQVFYPMVNRNNRLMFTSRIALLVIGIFLSIVMYASSDLVINAWLRNEPISNLKIIIGIVKILSPLPFLVAVISSYGVNGLLTFFKDSLFSYITIIATLAMIISAWILIPIFSFYGGAMALLIGRMVYAVLTFFSFKKIV
jgi:O-antigen/teichoic acid export membrane protein